MLPMTQKEFEASLLKFITTEVSQGSGRRISTRTPLFSDGLIDSLKILELIAFVESTLGIHIPDAKVTARNFRSVQAVGKAFWKKPGDL